MAAGDEQDAPEGDAAIGPVAFPTFLTALFDEVNVEILRATALEFLSVKEIAKTCELPMRACYRRVQALLKEGLLCPRPDEPDSRGRPPQRYRSNIDSVFVKLQGSDYKVRLEWPGDGVDVTAPPSE